MGEWSVAPARDDAELEAFLPVMRRTYPHLPTGREWIDWVPTNDMRLIRRGDRLVGGLQVVPMGQWFGGRSVPMTGISIVGIEPAARASGAGSVLMREVLLELARAGVPISTLYPATKTVYRRLGWELAGSHIRYALGTDEIDVRDRELAVDLSDDRDAFKAIDERQARRTAGVLDRNEDLWTRIFDPHKKETQAYLFGDEGYIVYSLGGGSGVRNELSATSVVALTPRAARRILTFVADHRSFTGSFHWNGPPNDPFAFVLSEPRTVVRQAWPWMLRIVDLPSALSQRGYPQHLDAELHVRVRDDVLEGNDGDWILTVAHGKGEVQRGGSGSLAVDVRGLAALYTGYMSARELLATGYIEGTEDDLERATSLFAGPAPWLPDFF